MSSDEQSLPQAQFSRINSLGYKFYRLAQLFARSLDARLTEYGVTIGQFRVMLVLWEREQLTQVEIARYLGIEQPTVASALKRMERDGLIEIKTHPSDRRRLQISLTEHGQKLKEPLTREAQFINELAVKGLSNEEIDQLNRTLDNLASALMRIEN